jgi:hypothetical protein
MPIESSYCLGRVIRIYSCAGHEWGKKKCDERPEQSHVELLLVGIHVWFILLGVLEVDPRKGAFLLRHRALCWVSIQ